jgi:hypothetical protein
MVKHVVMWKMRGPSPEQKREQASQIQQALLGLRGKIPGLLALEVGVAAATQDDQADVVLITQHEDWSAFKGYQEHPEHEPVAKLIGELRSERRAVDFEIKDAR